MTEPVPRRGEIWNVDLGDPVGHEAAFVRPCLVVSTERLNAHGLAVLCPMTRTERSYPTRVSVEPGLSGLDVTSFVQVEQVRTVSTRRMTGWRGRVESADMAAVENILRMILEL